MERDSDATEFGSNLGDARENDPSLPGFTDEDDRLFRSHFQHANRLDDRAYEDVRPAYRLGYDASVDPRFRDKGFEEVEKDLEGAWLNVRFAGDMWQAVRIYAHEGFDRGRQIGFGGASGTIGETPSHMRPSFADPVAGNIDPTAPDSPEQSGST